MIRFWEVDGLPEHLRETYGKLNDHRVLICIGNAKLSVYDRPLTRKEVKDVEELKSLGLLVTIVVGRRKVLRLGVWDYVEIRPTLDHKTSRYFSGQLHSLLSRYSPEQVVILEKAFDAIAATRKRKNISSSVVIKTLEQFHEFKVDFVIAGITEYLRAERQRGEKHVMSCIRDKYRKWRDCIIKTPEQIEREKVKQEKAKGHTKNLEIIGSDVDAERKREYHIDQIVDELIRKKYGGSVDLRQVPVQVLKLLRKQATALVV